MLANVTAPMSTEEAQSWEREVGQSVNHLRQLLWTGYQREAWHSLGYESWTDCLHALAHKYGFSERHAWRLHSANSTEDLLTPGSVGDIPEKHLRPLTGLTPEQQREAWEEAVATAPDGNVTGRHVQDVVARLSGNGNGHQHSGLAEFERGYQREVEAEREHPCVRCGEIYPEYELIEEPRGVWFCEACHAETQAVKEEAPDLYQQLLDGEKPSKIKYELNARRKLERAQRLCREMAGRPVLQKTYNVVLTDNPWEYENEWVNGAAINHYNTLPLEVIKQVPETIGLDIADDAVLFMWTTSPQLQKAFEVIEAWGFEYKAHIVWEKDSPNVGTGWYVRIEHELLLIAVRGSFTPLDKHISPPISSVVKAEAQEHSRKPDVFHEIIERLYPFTTRIELFARRERNGWDVWGNEVGA